MGKRSKREAVKRMLDKREAHWHRIKHFNNPGMYQDNQGNELLPYELVFPILHKKDNGEFVAIGTGFFVHPAGGFVTAKHCLFNNDVYDDKCYVVHTIGRGHHELRKIQYFEPHPTADVGMGMLRGQLHNGQTGELLLKASFPISIVPIQIGEAISTLGYPRMKIKNNVGIFRCDQFEGKIIEHLPEGTAWVKDECFQTNMPIRSGASGGPVLRENHIIGVNSSSIGMADIEEPISFITPIKKVMDLRLRDSDGKETSLMELADSGHLPLIK